MRLTLEAMRKYKRELAGMDDRLLASVVVWNRDASTVLPSHPWSFYHLARDEQINRFRDAGGSKLARYRDLEDPAVVRQWEQA